MAGRAHHRGPTQALERSQTPPACREVYEPFGSMALSPAPPIATNPLSEPWDVRPAMFCGRPISRWTRYGRWSDDASEVVGVNGNVIYHAR